eukprot:Nitzschia sp. Nitz4//scaffold178_size73299//59350//60756//NITZ4_005717-RA/size73299-processed-gene-0.35-mRNA-1//-1//CDS//3329539176//3963//frame0
MRRRNKHESSRATERASWEIKEINRPPLMPMPNAGSYMVPSPSPMPQQVHYCTPNDHQRVFFSKSEQTQSPMYGGEETDKFELMNISVVVYGLNGLMCEKEEKQKTGFGIRSRSFKQHDSSASRVSGSTISSFGIAASEEGELMDTLGAPTTAVVSFQKNTYSSQTALETFLPSVPLHHPLAVAGSKFRYQASWPSEQSMLNRDTSAIERSSFHLSRCMKQNSFTPGTGAGSNYVHETLELRINLSRGTELIRLGVATLVISGEEEGEVQMNIPAKPLRQKEKKLTRNRVKFKSNKYGFFTTDLTRRFYLDENATIRVGVRVFPQESMVVQQNKDRKENDLRQVLGSQDLKQAAANMAQQLHGYPQKCFYNNADFEERNVGEEDAKSDNVFQNIFCGAMFCGNSKDQDGDLADIPREIRAFDYGNLGIGSLVSSVSESTDGSGHSEESVGNLEAELNNFRAVTMRRYT